MIYYNPQTKDTKTKEELKNELHCSLSATHPEKTTGYYLVNNGEIPSHDESSQRVIADKIVKKNGKYVQTYKLENIPEDEVKSSVLARVHAECDAKLDATDYLFNSDYDGTGSTNTAYINAVKQARSTWRKLRQSDEYIAEAVPDIPKYKDFV